MCTLKELEHVKISKKKNQINIYFIRIIFVNYI